jgi:hypothetical protein
MITFITPSHFRATMSNVSQMDHITQYPVSELPHWLCDPQQPTPDDPVLQPSRAATTTRLTLTYPALFENALERVMSGTPLSTIIANDARGIQLGRFVHWINRDPIRKARYEEACMVAAEVMAHELTSIADATDTLEDVQRSALRIKARQYLMEKWSRQRYGESKHIQIDQTSVSATLSTEDLRRMSLTDLKKMALDMVRTSAGRDDEVVVEESDG